jgi:hypothetical protein
MRRPAAVKKKRSLSSFIFSGVSQIANPALPRSQGIHKGAAALLWGEPAHDACQRLWLAASVPAGVRGTRPPRLSPGGGNGKGGVRLPRCRRPLPHSIPAGPSRSPFCPASIRTLLKAGVRHEISGCCLLTSELAVFCADHASSAATAQSPRPSASGFSQLIASWRATAWLCRNGSYWLPSHHSRCSNTASFRATATAARFLAFLPPRWAFCPHRFRSVSGPIASEQYFSASASLANWPRKLNNQARPIAICDFRRDSLISLVSGIGGWVTSG